MPPVQDPPVELTQPQWWVSLPNPLPGLPAYGMESSIRLPAMPSMLNRSVDAVDVRESATEVYCLRAAASTYSVPSSQQHQGLSRVSQRQSTACAPASASSANHAYPNSSRGSSDNGGAVPGFFGHLPLGKGAMNPKEKWGLSISTEPSSRDVSREQQGGS